MRNFILKSVSLTLGLVIFSTQTLFAIPTASALIEEDIKPDIENFEAEFEELDKLEAAVLAQEVVTAEEALMMGFEIEQFAGIDAVEADLEFDWPSALWGFLCCPIGFFVVVTNKNKTKDEKTSFWIGFAAGTVLNLIYVAAVGVDT